MSIAQYKTGFSLVELSIVLVIIGLLTGGILAGQSLIRASELRNIVTEYQKYTTAVQTFRDKYQALPGDMSNATKFWGVAGAGPTNCVNILTDTGSGTATCNGDGNGHVVGATYAVGTGAGSGREAYRFWQHLQNAGLIEGGYSGVAGPTGNDQDILPGTNVPLSKAGRGAGWNVTWNGFGDDVPNAERFDPAVIGEYGHVFTFGPRWSTYIINLYGPPYGTDTAVLKADEAWNIDTKLDDGKPGMGKIIGVSYMGCTTASSATDITASYQLSSSLHLCNIVFRNAF